MGWYATKATMTREWETLVGHTREFFGCAHRSIASCYRVERKMLAHSMRLTIWCDFYHTKSEFKLGYAEIHEDGLLSWEYANWLKGPTRPADEVVVKLSDPNHMMLLDSFFTDLKLGAEGAREREHQKYLDKIQKEKENKERLEKERLEKEERKRLEQAELDRQIRRQEEERRRVRRIKEAARRVRRKQEQEERNRQRAIKQAQEAEQRRLSEAAAAARKEREEREKADRKLMVAARLRGMREDNRAEYSHVPVEDHVEWYWSATMGVIWVLGVGAVCVGSMLVWFYF